MRSLMVESATDMLDRWGGEISSGRPEIDVEREIIRTAGEIIAKTSFGISNGNGRKVLEKLRDVQITLFKTNRYVGVPFGKFLNPKETLEAKALGKEIDALLREIIADRRGLLAAGEAAPRDLLGMLMVDDAAKKRALTTKELVDECKTFFFAGHETTALSLTWTLLLLAVHPEWQEELREEIKLVVGDGEIRDATMLAGLKKVCTNIMPINLGYLTICSSPNLFIFRLIIQKCMHVC